MPDFDKEYVTKLREEAAQWRTKFRELEANGLYKDVEVEMAKRNIKADPTWVEVKEGQSVSDAVDALVAQHPHLSTTTVTTTTTEDEPSVRRPQTPRVMATGSRVHPETPANHLQDRTPAEIKKDPVARSKLRDQYRALLAASSNQPNHEY